MVAAPRSKTDFGWHPDKLQRPLVENAFLTALVVDDKLIPRSDDSPGLIVVSPSESTNQS